MILPSKSLQAMPRRSLIPFLTVSALMILLCIKGGRFGHIGEAAGQQILPLIPAGRFILLFALTWAVMLLMLLLFPRSCDFPQSARLIIGLALICRIALLPHMPSDDVNRYLWEGKLVNAGINPYLHPPCDPALAPLAADDPYHGSINHPDLPAAYPPLVLLLFSGIARLSYMPGAIKLVMILLDMGTIWFLMRLLAYRRLPVRLAVLYAFNPVILYAFAGQGHFDVIQNFFFAGTLLFYDRKRWALLFLFAGLSVQSKYVAIIALPFFVRRNNLKYIWVAVATILIPFVPFLDAHPARIFESLLKFGSEYAFNGPVHSLLRCFFDGKIAPATFVCKLLFAGALVFGCLYFHPHRARFRDDPVPGCFFVMGALLLLSPTIHFWYIAWIIPFMALRPCASWTLLCLTISGYFVTVGILHNTGQWLLPLWAYLAEWIPLGLFFLRDIQLFIVRCRAPVDAGPPSSISVVIPAYNEAEWIEDCVQMILKDKAVGEVIVVDGGSSDRTGDLARKAGATIILHNAPPENGGGRGGQIGAGVKASTGDIVAVVHADTYITAPAFTRILEMLVRQPTIAGGAVGGIFDGSGWKIRLLEIANDFRAAFTGISFGDQVQFFRRKPMAAQNLFPAIPLMEDVELGLRIQRLGRTVFLHGDALISARQWQTGVSRRTTMILRLFSLYMWKRLWGKTDTLRMYRQYYRKE